MQVEGEEGDEGDEGEEVKNSDDGDTKWELLRLWWCQLSHGNEKQGCQLTAQKEVLEASGGKRT